MKTMKKFWVYFILFILLFLFVSILTYLGTRNKNNVRDVECLSSIDIPIDVYVDKCQATNRKGHIEGSIVNNTGKIITDRYLQISYFDENNYLIGSQFEKINYFNVKEKIPFNFIVKGNHINKVVISLVDENTKIAYENNHSNILSSVAINEDTLWGAFLAFLIFY